MESDRPLSLREARFCELYVRLGIAGPAAEGAGYSPRRARQTGYDLLKRPEVQDRIEALRCDVAAEAKIETADLLRYFWTIATADPRELVEYRHTACRHCWGANHDRQRTEREIAKDRADWEFLQATKKKRRRKPAKGRKPTPVPEPVFPMEGGAGWDPDREPHPNCPECFGHGVETTHVHDTRLLSPAARLLYAGMKETKDGREVKMLSQMDAADRVGKILGAFREVQEHRDLTLEDLIRAAAGDEAGDSVAPTDRPDAGHAE